MKMENGFNFSSHDAKEVETFEAFLEEDDLIKNAAKALALLAPERRKRAIFWAEYIAGEK